MIPSMESSMRAVAPLDSPPKLTLDQVFCSRAQVKLLRVLAVESDEPVAPPEVAARTGMTPSGARKALRRLAEVGLAERVGAGRTSRYVLRREGRLASEITHLFLLERKSFDPSPEAEEPGGPKRNGNARRPALSQENGSSGSDTTSVRTARLDPASTEFNDALVALLEEDLSLIRRARERVLEKLENRHPGNGHDLWEWRKILDTYPLPRLLHFLESDSPRAVRLRESSPFPEVLSDAERERLGRFVERVH